MFEYMHPKDGPVFEGLEKLEVVYAADQPQYIPLRTLRSVGANCDVFSRWSPTPEQRKAIAEGADILLDLMTFHGPLQPIRMAVVDGTFDTDWVRVYLLDMPAEKHLPDDVVQRPDGKLEAIAEENEEGNHVAKPAVSRDEPAKDRRRT